jgi:LemA protein
MEEIDLLWAGIAGLAVVLLFTITVYNKIRKLTINVDKAFADLDAFLTKRVDQLDNLIQTARVATDKEVEVLENVTGLRAGIMDAKNMDDKIKAHNNVNRQLPGIMVTFERYPEVKFNENYMHIQRSINQLEEEIQAARRNFNMHVGEFNKTIAVFPNNMMAGMFGFKEKPMFEAPPEKRENVDVKALFNR